MKIDIDDVAPYYEGRPYHNIKHIEKMLASPFCVGEAFRIAVLFHDIVYDPRSLTNEEDSVALMHKWIWYHGIPTEGINMDLVDYLIMATKHHEFSDQFSPANFMIAMDLDVLNSSYDELLVYEKQIREEYKFLNDFNYWVGRMTFLANMIDKVKRHSRYFYTSTVQDLTKLREYVRVAYRQG